MGIVPAVNNQSDRRTSGRFPLPADDRLLQICRSPPVCDVLSDYQRNIAAVTVGIADPVAADFLPFGPPRGGMEEIERTRMGVHRDFHRIGKMTLHGIAQNDTASAAVFRRIYDGKRNSAEKLPANRNVA